MLTLCFIGTNKNIRPSFPPPPNLSQNQAKISLFPLAATNLAEISVLEKDSFLVFLRKIRGFSNPPTSSPTVLLRHLLSLFILQRTLKFETLVYGRFFLSLLAKAYKHIEVSNGLDSLFNTLHNLKLRF